MKRFFEKYQIEILLLLFLLPVLAGTGPIALWACPYYFVDYSTGFGGRKLVGELCRLWLPESGAGPSHLAPLLFLVHAVAIWMFVLLAGSSLRKARGSRLHWLMLGLLAVYMLGPYSFKGAIQFTSGYLDIFLIDYSLIFCWLFVNKRGSRLYYVSTAVLLLAAGLTHHIFCCIFFPLFLSLFAYDVFEGGFNAKKFWIYGCFSLGLFALFCYFVFASPMAVDCPSLVSRLQGRTSLDINYDVVYYEYYAGLREHIPAFILPNWKQNLARFVLNPVFLLPLYVVFCLPLVVAAIQSKPRIRSFMYFSMVLSQALILPAFVMAVDYGRWYYAFFFCQFMQTWVLCANDDKGIQRAMESIWQWIGKHPLIAVFLLLAAVGVFKAGSAPTFHMIDPVENCILRLGIR